MTPMPAPGGPDPDRSELWHRVVAGADDATLAHAPEWNTAIRRAYGHEPLYLDAEDRAGQAAILPAYVVRRPLLRPVVASMPFLDAGGPCGAAGDLSRVLVERLVEEGRRVGASSVELRCTRRLPVPLLPAMNKVKLVLALPPDAGSLWKRLDPGVRSQIRKAERSRLAIETSGRDGLAAFHAVLTARMRDLGSPVHARAFFDAAFEAFGSRARLVL